MIKEQKPQNQIKVNEGEMDPVDFPVSIKTSSAKDSISRISDIRKKHGKLIIVVAAVALLAVLSGVGFYSMPVNRVGRHLNLGARYLEEKKYEQAIIEFDKAIAIDPMNVEAYLGKAQAYQQSDNLSMTLATLQDGYGLTGNAELEDFIKQLVQLDFSLADIKIMGYDLFMPHWEEIIDALGISIESYEYSDVGLHTPIFTYGDGHVSIYDIYDGTTKADGTVYRSRWIDYCDSEENWPSTYRDCPELGEVDFLVRNNVAAIADGIPILPQDTIETIHETMQFGMIESMYELSEDMNWKDYNGENSVVKITTKDDWELQSYSEDVDGCIGIHFRKENEKGNLFFTITCNSAEVQYVVWRE